MYTLVFKNGDRAVMGAGTRAIILSAADRAALDADYPGWLGLFDTPGAELSALHAGCTSRHHNPLMATYPWPHSRTPTARPTLGSYTGPVESLAATTAGTEILILRDLPRFGAVWMPAKVIHSLERVALASGKVISASTIAAALIDREAIGDGKAEITADGSCWRRSKDGTVTRLRPFAGPVSTLGQVAASGAREVVILDGERWSAAEVA